MRYLRILAVLGLCLIPASYAHAQRVAIGLGIGGPAYVESAPACTYGYYGYYPYACAPDGYYGPSWFSGGLFIGAGPWFHGYYGGRGFYGRGYDGGFRGGYRGGDFHGGGGFHGRGGHGGGHR